MTDDLPTLQYPRVGLSGDVEVPEGLVGVDDPVVAALPAATTARPSELRELLLARHLAPLLRARPDDPHLQALLRVGQDDAGPARRQLEVNDEDDRARFVLARRAWMQGRWADALALLEAVDPEPVGRARHALLRGGALGALGRDREARVAFDIAERASDSAAFVDQLSEVRGLAPADW